MRRVSGQDRRDPVAPGLVPRRNVRSAAGDKPPPCVKRAAVDELAERGEAFP